LPQFVQVRRLESRDRRLVSTRRGTGTAIAAFGIHPEPVMSDSPAHPSNATATRHTVLPVLAVELALGGDDKTVGALRVRIEVEASPRLLPGEECVDHALVQRVPRDAAARSRSRARPCTTRRGDPTPSPPKGQSHETDRRRRFRPL